MAALNDPARTRIGNPRRGTFHVSIAVDEFGELTMIREELESLGVSFQTNYRRDQTGEAFVAIYDLESQRCLLTTVGDDLQDARRDALDLLVRARGPALENVLVRIEASVNHGKSYAYIAERMTNLGIIDGMGKGWTAKKLRKVHADYLERLRQERNSSKGRSAAQ